MPLLSPRFRRLESERMERWREQNKREDETLISAISI